MKRFPPILSAFPAPQKQRGVVLIIALVMLLILTLIGVAGLRDTQLQERMAGGAQDRELALQAAETALRTAEGAITSGNAAADNNGDQYRDYRAPLDGGLDSVAGLQRQNSGGVPVIESVYWRDVYDWTGNGGNNSFSDGTSLSGLSAQPLYVIERLPYSYSAVPGSFNASGTAGDPLVSDYIITARAVGSSPDAVVILQSHFRVVE